MRPTNNYPWNVWVDVHLHVLYVELMHYMSRSVTTVDVHMQC